MGTAKAGSRWRPGAERAAAVFAAALVLSWPALWAGYPQWCPDAVTYLLAGRKVWQMLLGDQALPRLFLRSELYCAGIFLLHWGVSPWPVLALNALLIAWTLWLVVRTLPFKTPIAIYLGVVVAASAVTTVSWSVTMLLPDICGAALYLVIYLLVFAGERLRQWETVTLFLLGSWLVNSHPTHMVLALGLCGVLGGLWVLRWAGLRGRGRPLLLAAAMVLVGCAAQTAANARIFGRPMLLDPQPPFALARIVADGPSHQYLAEHCATLAWVLCRHVADLPFDEGEFLWKSGGIWESASPEERQDLAAETLPLVLGTLRNYPRAQLRRSWHNFIDELTIFGVEDGSSDNPWMIGMLNAVFPGARERFLRSAPRYNGLPLRRFSRLQERVVAVAAMVCLGLLPWAWRRGELRLLGLAGVVAYVAIANALLTGVLSGQSARYEGRVIWLVPVLAALMAAVLMRRSPNGRPDPA